MPPKNDFERKMNMDPKWAAVDEYTMSHLHPASRPNHAPLAQALQHSAEQGLPAIFSSSTFGKFLALQARVVRAEHMLEVGTLGGYAAIWVATENPGIRVTTLEVDAATAEVARQNIERAGVADRVDVRVGPALELLPLLQTEIDEGKLPRLGLTFIDADKGNNYNYLDWAVKLSKPGACVLVDNVVQGGTVVDPEAFGRNHISGARDVIEKAGRDERVDAVVMQHVCDRNYDGFLFAVVK